MTLTTLAFMIDPYSTSINIMLLFSSPAMFSLQYVQLTSNDMENCNSILRGALFLVFYPALSSQPLTAILRVFPQVVDLMLFGSF